MSHNTSRVDIIDETYLRAAPAVVRGWFDDADRLDRLWPHLRRTLVRDRGPKGLRWRVDGAVVGEMEVWIEPYWDGVVLHHYVRGSRGRGAPADVAARHQLRWKRAVHALKDVLEEGTL